MDQHIVWSGELRHKKGDQVPFRSLWAVLMRESVFGPKRLELYHNYTDYTNSCPAAAVIDLGDMTHVERDLWASSQISTAPTSPSCRSPSATSPPVPKPRRNKRPGGSRPILSTSKGEFASQQRLLHQFTVATEKGTHVFAARTGDESSFWVGKLNELLHGPPEHGVTYEFPVSVLPTSLSKTFALRGNHVLRVSEKDISLYDATGAVPTSFVCSLEAIEAVTCSPGNGSKAVSIQCSSVHGAQGAVTLSTKSSADIIRILDHRRMVATDTSEGSDQPQHNSQLSQQQWCHDNFADSAGNDVSHTSHYYRRSTSTELVKTSSSSSQHDHELHTSSSVTIFDNLTLSLDSARRHRGRCQHSRHRGNHLPQHPDLNVHASITMATQPTERVSEKGPASEDEGERSSSSDLEEDEVNIKSYRKESGEDFECVTSWVRRKDEDGNKLPGASRGRLSHPRLLQFLPRSSSDEPKDTTATGVPRRTHLSRFFSSGSNNAEEQVYFEISPVLIEEGDAPQSLVSNESYEFYDIKHWRIRQSTVTNGKDRNQQQTAETPSSSHDYESLNEDRQQSLYDYDTNQEPQSLPDYEDIEESNYSLAGKRSTDPKDNDSAGDMPEDKTVHKQRKSLPNYVDIAETDYSLAGKSPLNLQLREEFEDGDGTTPDYDYVKYRILGVRGGIPEPLPSEPLGSDEEEPYYY